jgi:hypothetical protein
MLRGVSSPRKGCRDISESDLVLLQVHTFARNRILCAPASVDNPAIRAHAASRLRSQLCHPLHAISVVPEKSIAEHTENPWGTHRRILDEGSPSKIQGDQLIPEVATPE